MNNKAMPGQISLREVIEFQAQIDALFLCCQERMRYLSERFSLPEAEMRCLLLFRNERYLTAKAITSKLNVAKSRVTMLVSGLLQKGLIERIDDPNDIRIKLLKLTSKGEKIVVELYCFREELHGKVLERFSPEQRMQLLDVLSMLRRAMESVKELLV